MCTMITTINATAANECSINANRITGIEKAGAKYGRQMITRSPATGPEDNRRPEYAFLAEVITSRVTYFLVDDDLTNILRPKDIIPID